MLSIRTPSTVEIIGHDDQIDKLKHLLTYIDKGVTFQITKCKQNKWLKERMGEEKFQEYIDKLKEQEKVCLLNEKNGLSTYSGLAEWIAGELGTTISNQVEYPKYAEIPWDKTPEFKMYPYQENALAKLLEAKHASVEIGTGLGKSYIILHLAKAIGLKTVIMAPYNNIAQQLYDDFAKYFGVRYVGKYFDGKKQFDKRFVIASGQSLTRLEPGDEAYEVLSQSQVFIADESHFTPAATLEKVCLGLMAKAPYRYFFSATQLRNDGAGLLLQGITGPIVYKMDVREGVDQGYLAKPIFRMIRVESKSKYGWDDHNEKFDYKKDPLMMERNHLFYNKNVLKVAADIANRSVSLLGHPVLILVEEMEQFADLYPLLKHKCAFAHGPLTKESKEKLPEAFHDSDPTALVKSFNAGEIPILVGTSCVSTGTNFKAVKTLIYLQGGRSEVQIRQALGRSTRLHGDKTACAIYDFDVWNVPVIHRHATERKGIYDGIYGPVQEITNYEVKK